MNLVRHIPTVLTAALLLAAGALALVSVLGPRMGVELVVIRGASMEPAIPRGAAILIKTDTGRLAVGDAASYRLASGTLVTHRIVRVADNDGELFYEFKGDANEDPDPVVVADEQVVGRVELSAPVLGYVLAYIRLPTGILSIATLIAALLVPSLFGSFRAPKRPARVARP